MMLLSYWTLLTVIGIGKTSLIKAIFQTCEDIVHVDELSTSPLSVSQTKRTKRTATPHITEVYASTRSYPTWWSEADDGKVLRRRKSMGDSVLERNLCFVDTPGYGNGASVSELMDLYEASLIHLVYRIDWAGHSIS